MNDLLNKVGSANEAGLEALRTAVSAYLDGVGQLATLNLRTARAAVERGAENLSTLSDVRDFQGLMALREPMAVAALEQTMAYSRRAYHICSESSTTMTEAFEGQFGRLGGGVVAAIDKGRKSLSPAVSLAVAVAKSLMAMANRTAGEVDQLARPVAGNTAAAGSAVVKLIEKKD